MTTSKTPVLAPLRRHPELATVDDATLTLFADTLGIDVIRDWDGGLSTTIADAWRIREHFDAEHLRQAEADNARLAALEAADEVRLGPIRRRMETARRRSALAAEIGALAPEAVDERYLEWERRANEMGAALFANMNADANRPAPDTRTPVERLKAAGK